MAREIPTVKSTRQRLFEIRFGITQPDTAEMLDFGDDGVGFSIKNAGRILIARYEADQVGAWGDNAPVGIEIDLPSDYTMSNVLVGVDVFPGENIQGGLALTEKPALGVLLTIKGILDV